MFMLALDSGHTPGKLQQKLIPVSTGALCMLPTAASHWSATASSSASQLA
jgi:hypothetical protein